MSKDSRPRVVETTLTCPACPTQWEGKLADGRVIYVRYRYGTLAVGLGDTVDDAVDNSFSPEALYNEDVGGLLDGILGYDELVALLRNRLIFPPA